jgi:RimJ/RimL family protein N-acetyltransferase
MKQEKITVRKFEPQEWPSYRDIRLKALQTDPQVFSSTYEKECVHPDEKWKQDLMNPNRGAFGVYYSDNLIGMTGVAVDKSDPSSETGVLWGSWLEKEWRGKGISEKMYEARIEWAKKHPSIKRLIVSHREHNIASKKANQKQGFAFTHSESETWHDGKTEKMPIYELRLR